MKEESRNYKILLFIIRRFQGLFYCRFFFFSIINDWLALQDTTGQGIVLSPGSRKKFSADPRIILENLSCELGHERISTLSILPIGQFSRDSCLLKRSQPYILLKIVQMKMFIPCCQPRYRVDAAPVPVPSLKCSNVDHGQYLTT